MECIYLVPRIVNWYLTRFVEVPDFDRPTAEQFSTSVPWQHHIYESVTANKLNFLKIFYNFLHIQTVHLDACVCAWCCAGLHPKHVDLGDWAAWSLAPSFCCVWIIRRATHTNEIWDQGVLSCRTDSMECSATRAACNRWLCVFPEKT